MNIRPASRTDLNEIQRLLSQHNLPTADINENSVQFFVGESGCEIYGVIGLEKYDNIGLLRSLVVKESYKGQNLGLKLVNYLFEFGNRRAIQELFLLTDTAVDYFKKIGFVEIEKESTPKKLKKPESLKNYVRILQWL
jgi:amino-acid N-acetyltransferase